MAEPEAEVTEVAEVELIEFPKELFMFKRPVEKPVLPSPVLGTRTVNSAEEQAAAEAEGWYADQESAAAAVDVPAEEPVVDEPVVDEPVVDGPTF